eukprot:jgi/Undpi1/7604/HiC_scaffold_23.g10077.m1
MSLMDVAIAMVARSASADTDVRSEHQQKHQRPNHREAARATAGATAGEAAEEQVLHNPDVRAEIIAFVGGRQLQAYIFVGRVSMAKHIFRRDTTGNRELRYRDVGSSHDGGVGLNVGSRATEH